MAIISFRQSQLKDFMETGIPPRNISWRSIRKTALRKLDMLHYAKTLNDLKSPPGNRLEALKGDLIGYYSLRINDQWRIIFQWTIDGPREVEIVDYHF
ncbi:MAG: type II toxin-antitoxin system RelE/ParE family toxin [Bacteriovorax sp.]|jgi:proteic killer suppression protein